MKRIIKGVAYALGSFDWPLFILLLLLSVLGMVLMYSAVGGTDWRFSDQIRNYVLAFGFMWIAAMIPLPVYVRFAPWLYVLGLCLLLAVTFFGESSKGATRWLNIGFARIQPSEMMKIIVPLALAWYFQKHKTGLRLLDFLLASVLLAIPFTLIVLQPDLGTSLLVFAAGFCIIYFAGLSFWLLVPIAILMIASLGLLTWYQDIICQPEFDWVVLRDYQKHRICTLLDPSSDPLGKGFHTIQSMIAVGSGGIYGKGYMLGTQAHLDFIPERTTDFIFAVYAEEFGLYGGIMLLTLYGLLVARGLTIAAGAHNQFGRLFAGAISMMFFVYVFVNVGMVSGVLPIVGIPLPFMSYGGTALLVLGVACGMLMSIHNYRPSNT